MSDQTLHHWWLSPNEYVCEKCGSMAKGYMFVKRSVSMPPNEAREALKSWPFEYVLEPWKNNDGCTVILFPDQYEKYRKNKVVGDWDAGANVLLCTGCHRRTLLDESKPTSQLYWIIETRHGVIWAHNRQHLAAIRDHIKLERRPKAFTKLPAWMLASKNRNEMLKLIDKALANGPSKI